VPEWRTTIDALQSLPRSAPIGYSGMTLATAIGIPLAVADPRIRAAIFGGVFVYDAALEAARRVTIPIEFLLPWDDAEIDRESGLALFDAFASEEKTLHAFPGSHFRVPAERIERRCPSPPLRTSTPSGVQLLDLVSGRPPERPSGWRSAASVSCGG
jgi:hypothetical protein